MVADSTRLAQQNSFAELILGFLEGTQALQESRTLTLSDLETRLELLERYYTPFFENHIALDPEKNEKSPYFSDRKYHLVTEAYTVTKAWHREQIAGLRASTRPPTRTGSDPPGFTLQSSLEHVKIPIFSGKNRDWATFRDKFTALVLNDESCMPVIKFHRLLNALEGEPYELLRQIPVDGANFKSAWGAICARYDDKLLRFNAQMTALVNLPSSSTENASHLSTLTNTANVSKNIFESLGLKIDDWDAIFVFHVESKLAPPTRLDWAKEREEEDNPFATYQELLTFLQKRIRTLERVDADSVSSDAAASSGDHSRSKQKPVQNKKSSRSDHRERSGSTSAHLAVSKDRNVKPPPKCVACGETHYLMRCPKFSELSVSERKNLVAKHRLCFNCLGSSHPAERCNSPHRCAVCQEKHHSKLHMDRHETVSALATAPGLPGEQQSPAAANLTHNYATIGGGTKILSTAIVLIESPSGSVYEARALLDSGSEESYLAEHVVQALGLPRRPTYVAVSSVGGQPTTVSRNWVDFKVKSKNDSSFSQQISALTLNKLTSMLPRTEVEIESWDYLRGLTLADPHCGKPGRVDCLLGVNVFANILRSGLKSGPEGCPSAISTVFGWVLMGGAGKSPLSQVENSHNFHISVDRELSQALARFWEIEEPCQVSRFSSEDQKCLDHFRKTVRRDSCGRFMVRLPFIETPSLPGSRDIALSSLRRMEKRFHRQPELRAAYSKFMSEYHQLQHMEVVPEEEVDQEKAYYIPHHSVVKGGNFSKIRVVFNAAAKAANGKCLNDFLYPGPNLLLDVRTVLINWRFKQFVFSCDIVKMFRQFLVDPCDRDWQRIAWRDSENEPFEFFRLNTATYGTDCAPFLANACLLELADQERASYPLGAAAIEKRRYADDFYEGADTSEELFQRAEQLVKVLSSAGMAVGKWASNHPPLLPEFDLHSRSVDISPPEDPSVSTLGLLWNPVEDFFHYRCPVPTGEDNPTKRSILSQIARLFDPLGYLAPFVVRAKILLQALWLSGVDWDSPIPTTIRQAWSSFQQELPAIEKIKIPRWVDTLSSTTWELHGFCDASERAYSASLYAVGRSETSRFSHLIYAKSRVSPLKVLNIPRLELCAAELLAQLISFVKAEFETAPASIHCWSDSTIVLAWLKGHPCRWKTFTANRVSEILTLIPEAQWRHVPTRDNPADCATRGLTSDELADFELWWHGPSWLLCESTQWPVQNEADFTTTLEEKKEAFCFAAAPEDLSLWSAWLQKQSSIHRITRILAYVARFADKAQIPNLTRQARVPQPSSLSLLAAREIQKGRILLWRLVKKSCFPAELQALSVGKLVSSSSPLSRLSPFIDPQGVLRVGGRLQNAALTEEERHPIILPSNHHIAKLLINDVHLQTLHGGPLVVQSVLFRQFWIVRGRNFIRGVIRRCVRCTRHNGHTIQQQMGPLPALRTRPSRPFTCTGVDYAGPFMVKSSPGRGRAAFKGYVSIFVCMVTKATHVEVVSDYSTIAFLAAFKRFVGRRGLCKTVYSDHGTNFRGADAELKRLFSQASAFSREVAASLASDGVEWQYIPPNAPNFGGLWEATVKAFKNHMKRVVGDALLTFEELSTLAAQIEACLNSRPVSLLTSNDEDVVALTPGHFLIGAALVSPPEPFDEYNDGKSNTNRWHLITQMRNHFWARWSQEYLTQLQQRMKWLRPQRNLNLGEVVLIKSELTPPTKWLMGRVVELIPSKDGLCRSVVVQCANGRYERPVSKLVPLPVKPEGKKPTTSEGGCHGGRLEPRRSGRRQ